MMMMMNGRSRANGCCAYTKTERGPVTRTAHSLLLKHSTSKLHQALPAHDELAAIATSDFLGLLFVIP